MSSGADPPDAAFPDYLYEEIDDFNLNERLQELQKSNDILLSQIQELKNEVQNVNEKCAALERQNEVLQTNMSTLFTTASSELSRKDRMYKETLSQLEKYQLNNRINSTNPKIPNPTNRLPVNKNFREMPNSMPNKPLQISNEAKSTNIENKYRRDDQVVKINPQSQNDKPMKRIRSPSPHRQPSPKRQFIEQDRLTQFSSSSHEDYKNRSSYKEKQAKRSRSRERYHKESSHSSYDSVREDKYGRHSSSQSRSSDRYPPNDYPRHKYSDIDRPNSRDSSNSHRPYATENFQNRNNTFSNSRGTHFDRINDRNSNTNRNFHTKKSISDSHTQNAQVVNDNSNMHKNLVDTNLGAKISEITHGKTKTYHHHFENYIREHTDSNILKVIKPFDNSSSDETPCSVDDKKNTVFMDPRSQRRIFNSVVADMKLENVKIDLSKEIENMKCTEKICKIISDKLLENGLIKNSKSVLNNENEKKLPEEKACVKITLADYQKKSKTFDTKSGNDTTVLNTCIDGTSDLQQNNNSNDVILTTKQDSLDSIKENFKTDPNCISPKNGLEKENLASSNFINMTKIDDSIITKVNLILNDVANGSSLENKNVEKVTNSTTKEKAPEKKVSKNKKDTKHSRSKDSKSKHRDSSSKKREKHKTESNKDSKHKKETSNENPVLNMLDSKKDTNEQENVVITDVCPEISPNTCDKDTPLSTEKNDIIDDNITPLRDSLDKKEITGIALSSPTCNKHTTVSPSIIDNNTITFTIHRRRNRIVKR